MKRYHLISISLAALAMLSACASPEMTDAQRTTIEQIVRQQGEEYLASVATHDADRVMAHFAKDDFSLIVNGVHYPSYEVVSDLERNFLSKLRDTQGGWDQVRVYVLGPDAAVFHGTAHILHTYTDGKIINFPEIFWTALYKHRDGEWKMVLVHESYRPPSTERE